MCLKKLFISRCTINRTNDASRHVIPTRRLFKPVKRLTNKQTIPAKNRIFTNMLEVLIKIQSTFKKHTNLAAMFVIFSFIC